MVEQRPSKPHVWVRFLLSLYMLLYKPTFFIFKKKLSNFTNELTKYIKKVNIHNLRNFKKIQFITHNDGAWDNFVKIRFKNNSARLRYILTNQWLLKKHTRLKLFSRSSVYSLNHSIPLLKNDTSTNPGFYWRKNHLIKTYTLTNLFRQSAIFLYNTDNQRYEFLKSINYHLFSSKYLLFSHWSYIISSLYQIASINALPVTSIAQFTKHFYSNCFSGHLKSQFRSNIFTLNQRQVLSPDLNSTQSFNIRPYNNTNIVSNSSQPTFSLRRVLKLRTRYLPHINLVRLFRYSTNVKPYSYSIDKNTFFRTPLIRLNADYKYYKLNTLQNKRTIWNSTKTYGNFLHNLSSDNLIEMNIDLTLNTPKNLPFRVTKKLSLTTSNFFNITPAHQLRTTFLTTLNRLILYSSDFINFKSIISQPLFYKYFFWMTNPISNINILSTPSLNSLTTHSFSSRINVFRLTNLWPSTFLNFTLKRKILKIFSFNKFLPNVTMWYYNLLIRFMESCTGKKVFLKFNPFIENFLSFSDIARCNMWSIRINSFQRLLGPKIFLNESLRIMHIALRFKDPTFFANWIKGMLNRMSFWKYRLLFRYIKFAMRYLFWLHFNELNFKGLKIKLKGKISVAGNARTRTLVYRIGETGYSKIENRVICDSSIINTFTGVLGFKIWFFF